MILELRRCRGGSFGCALAPLLMLLTAVAACGSDSAGGAGGLDAGADAVAPDDADSTGDTGTLDDAQAGDDAAPGDEVPFQTGLEVATASGRVRGQSAGGLRIFKGIPFAQPPVGDLRFRAPQPVTPWPEVLDAFDFGPSCMQEQFIGFTAPVSEDCLTLNVWAHRDDTPRPIMVWLYGGGFITGSASLAFYDGTQLARAADAVIVTLNYRLGPLGYLATPALQAAEPTGAAGNFGLLDQIEALRWIQQNAPAFGGDPTRVTVFGESAGAFSICALMGSPLADDLFHQAIVQSGGCHVFPLLDQAAGGFPSAYATGAGLVEDLGCGEAADEVACLRALPAESLVIPVAELFGAGLVDGISMAPVIDGVVLTESPFERIRQGSAPARPVIFGSNANEGALFTAYDVVLTRTQLREKILAFLGSADLTDAVLELYPSLLFPVPKSAYDAFVGEILFNCNSYHAAAAAAGPAYYYYLNLGPLLLTTPWGPLHGTDVFYTFGTFAAGGVVPSLFDIATRDLVQGAWGSFAHYGVPVVDSPPWPVFTEASPRLLQIEAVPRIAETFRGGRCDELRSLGLLP